MRSVKIICVAVLVVFLTGGCGNYAAGNLPGAKQVIEEIRRAGEAASTIFAEVEVNEPLDESLFTLNVPSDVQIINALPGAGFLPNVGAGQ